MGSPARRIGPGKQHPFPLPLAQFNSHSAPATPCCHRPLGQLSAPRPGLSRGREGRRCLGGGRRGHRKLQGPTAFAVVPRPTSPTTQRASPRRSTNGARAREKGRPGPDAPQESHAPCAGAAGSSPVMPRLRWLARPTVRSSRLS